MSRADMPEQINMDKVARENEPNELAVVEAEASDVVAEAEAIVITDDIGYEMAGRFLRDSIKAMRKKLAATFKPMRDKAHAAHKEIVAQEKLLDQPLAEAEAVVKRRMGTYYREQEIAREKAAQELLESAKREAEDEALNEAARLERDGKQEAADDRMRQPMAPVVQAPKAAAPAATGIAARKTWKFRIVAPGAISADYMKPDEVKIGKLVRAMGEDAEKLVGGIEVWQEQGIAAR